LSPIELEFEKMKKIVLSLITALGLMVGAQANTGGIAWDKAPNNINDMAALQSGAKTFVNYCLNCHAAAFMPERHWSDRPADQGQPAVHH
jgi:cytochrome c1